MKAHLIMTTLALVAVATNSAYAAPGVQVGAKAQTPGIQGNIDQTAPLLNGARGISTPSESGAQQSTKVLSLGDRASGGGNTVGDQLFDDYENSGSAVIPPAEIADLAAPTLNDLAQKVPGFAKKLREGINGIIWYKEPKPLSQDGVCRNGADTGLTPAIGQVVRACQNNLDVRIEQNFYEQHKQQKPELLAGLIVHELIVYQRIHSSQHNVSEESVYLISRDVRTPSLSEDDVAHDLEAAGFGRYLTYHELEPKRQTLLSQIKWVIGRAAEEGKIICQANRSKGDGVTFLLGKKVKMESEDAERYPKVVENLQNLNNADDQTRFDSLYPYISAEELRAFRKEYYQNLSAAQCP